MRQGGTSSIRAIIDGNIIVSSSSVRFTTSVLLQPRAGHSTCTAGLHLLQFFYTTNFVPKEHTIAKPHRLCRAAPRPPFHAMQPLQPFQQTPTDPLALKAPPHSSSSTHHKPSMSAARMSVPAGALSSTCRPRRSRSSMRVLHNRTLYQTLSVNSCAGFPREHSAAMPMQHHCLLSSCLNMHTGKPH